MTILLAAGGSRRFGRGDKLLAPLGGRPLIDHALDRALAGGAGRVIAVVPSAGGRVGRYLRRRTDARVSVAVARNHARGMGASLTAGLARVRPFEREIAVLLGDMPAARVDHRLRLTPGRDAACPMVNGVPGHPLLVRADAARVAGLGPDDRGLAARLNPARIRVVRGHWGATFDVDTVAALRRARLRWGSLRCWN